MSMAETTTTGNQTVNPVGSEYVIERNFKAPRELVYRAFTRPEQLAKWWGPKGWTTTVYKMDVRPGGVWHYCMRGPDGMEAWGLAVYQEVVEPERLVYQDNFSDEAGNLAEGMPEMMITLEFVEQQGQTRVVNRAVFASAADLEAVLKMGMEQGLKETWDNLEAFLAEATSNPA